MIQLVLGFYSFTLRTWNLKHPLKGQKANLFYKVVLLVACSASNWCATLFATPWTRLPGPSVHGISLAGILEWVAFSFSRESSCPGI